MAQSKTIGRIQAAICIKNNLMEILNESPDIDKPGLARSVAFIQELLENCSFWQMIEDEELPK